MKVIILALAVCVAGCPKPPCVETAQSAAAMGRHCKARGDAKLKDVCEQAYTSVRHELTTGVCASEVAEAER